MSSPLLEDINLAGAHGILVNVTAGMDLSIGEFQEVGQIVKQFASEDATVVVGTVIDPELTQCRCGSRWWRPAWVGRPQRACRVSRTARRCPRVTRIGTRDLEPAARRGDARGAPDRRR